jgi:hypothetical protein
MRSEILMEELKREKGNIMVLIDLFDEGDDFLNV